MLLRNGNGGCKGAWCTLTAPVRLLQPLFPGIVLYLPFWEGGGTFAEDVSPFRNHGTLLPALNPPTWVDGVIGKALSFDGLANYVAVPYSATLYPNYITVACWINPSSFTGSRFIIRSRVAATDVFCYLLYMNGAILTFYCMNTVGTGQLSIFTLPTLNIQYHVVGTFDGVNTTLYVNGLQKDQDALVGTLKVGDDYVTIGTYKHPVPLYFFQGIIDEVRVYNRALTAPEVWEEYYRGARQNY